MARVALEGAVVDLLRQGDGGLDDDVAVREHPGQAHGARGDGDAVADGHPDGAPADKLRDRHQHGDAARVRRAQHGAGVAAPAGHGLEGKAVKLRQGQDLARQALAPQAHRIGHVPGRLDDLAVDGKPQPPLQELVVQGHLPPQGRPLRVPHPCELEQVAPRHLLHVHPEGRGIYAPHPVERAAHLVGDDGGARGDGIDQPDADQLRNEGRDPLVDVGTAPGDDHHPAPPLLDLYDALDRRGQGGARALVQRRAERLDQGCAEQRVPSQ